MPKRLFNHYCDQIAIYQDLCRDYLQRKDMIRYAECKKLLDELKSKLNYKDLHCSDI